MTNYNDVLFDDVALIQSMHNGGYTYDNYNDCTNSNQKSKNIGNLMADCNCSGYTNIEDEEFNTKEIA